MSSPTTSLNTKEVGERLTIGPAGHFCASQAPHLCLAAARINLRLAPPRRNTRTSVRVDGCLFFFHESSKSVSVSAMFRTKTVLFCLPGHPVLLCLLGDFHLHQVSELSLGKRRKPSPRHECDCSMHVRRVPFPVFLLAVLTTRLTDSVDHPLAKNTLAVATLVITIAGPLRTDTLDCRRISSTSPCAS